MPHRHELSEQQWRRITDLLPRDQGRAGRKPQPNRVMVNAMLWILRTGAPWRDLPSHYPKWKSVHTRFLRWSKSGVWKRVLDALAAGLDDELTIIDASIVRAHQDASGGAGEFQPAEKARFYRIALRSCTESAATLHTCQRRNLGDLDAIEGARPPSCSNSTASKCSTSIC